MSNIKSVTVPDIGDVSDVEIIDILVSVGDEINPEDSLITLETDKATMDVPSSDSGTVKALHIKVGDKVSQGALILDLEISEGIVATDKTKSEAKPADVSVPVAVSNDDAEPAETMPTPIAEAPFEFRVPDIGDANDVDVIEVLVAKGDKVEKDQGLIVLETDKATMEVPAEVAGTIDELMVSVGDKVSQGDLIAKGVAIASTIKTSVAEKTIEAAAPVAVAQPMPATADKAPPVPAHPQMKRASTGNFIHASPAVRRFARELGADLSKVSGTGEKSRILKEDVQNFIKFELSRPKATASSGAFAMPEMPAIDHSKWGEIQEQPLTRIQKVSSVNLHRNWITIPHVTQHEDADITELDAFRKSLKDEAAKDGVRLTPLAFIMKALVSTLKAFPKFNASLASDGENLVLKNYYHIGVAVETPDGLTVPVIRDVDQKSIYQLATELAETSAKARDKKLSADDMQGSSFTISSLGGIGGTAFTPIVKWPDVAILGLSRNKMQPVWNGKEFVPRMMLPMSLSYDHRVIDGADAARFVVHLAQTLSDIRRVMLK